MTQFSITYLLMLLMAIVVSHSYQALGEKIVFIPRFPDNLGPIPNVTSDLRRLPNRCREALLPNSTNEEKLACAIVTQPNKHGLFPFGLYKTGVPLFESLHKVGHGSVTKFFSDYAMVTFIQNGCFSYEVDTTKEAFYDRQTIVEKSDYASFYGTLEPTTVKSPFEVSCGFLSMTVSSSASSAAYSSSSSHSRYAKDTRRWIAEFGTLTLKQSCLDPQFVVANKIVDTSYLALWREFKTLPSYLVDTVGEIINHKSYGAIIEAGFYFPTKFAFATMYESDVTVSYEATSTFTSSMMKTSLTTSFFAEVSFFGPLSPPLLTLGFGNSNTQTDSFSSMDASSESKTHAVGAEYKYGNCNFSSIFEIAEESVWKERLLACSWKYNSRLESLPRAAYIPQNGFNQVIDIVTAHGFAIPSHFFEAGQKYFAYCTCNVPASSRTYSCYSPGGELLETRNTLVDCNWATWQKRDIANHPGAPLYSVRTILNPTKGSQGFSLTSPSGVYRLVFDLKTLKIQGTQGIKYVYPLRSADPTISFSATYGTLTVDSVNLMEPAPTPDSYALFLSDDGKLNRFNLNTKIIDKQL